MPRIHHFEETTNAEFHMYVGFCITAWAKVEEQLFEACKASLRAPALQAAIVYYRTPTVATRLSLVDELVQSLLPKPVKKNGGHPHVDVKLWSDIRGDIEGLLATRSRIAHHPVGVKYRFNPRFRQKSKETVVAVGLDLLSSFELYSSEAELLRGRSTHQRPLKVSHLSIHCVQVQKMAERLKTFVAETLQPHLR